MLSDADVITETVNKTDHPVKVGTRVSHAHKVAKNSFWLIIQPLVLNVISIFATAYIARMLGQGDYGKFTFAIAFVGMFAPFTSIGLRAITIREVAENRSILSSFLGKMITLRVVLAVITMAIAFFWINIAGYPKKTVDIVCIYLFSILFGAVSSTFIDVFQAYEKMGFVAWTQFIAGAILTILSVVVLYCGFQLDGLIIVYAFGSFLTLAISFWYVKNNFVMPRISFDLKFFKENLTKGAPFFYPSIAASVSSKLGIIMLSAISGDISVGIYGSANILIDRLMIIPDGVCTAIFPTIASLHKNSKAEAASIFRKFFMYLVLLGLPTALGITILSGPIVSMLYGAEYKAAAPILQILAWWLFFSFLTYIQNLALGAIHREKEVARIRIGIAIFGVLISLIAIMRFGVTGLAVSSVATAAIYFLLLSRSVNKYLTRDLLDFKGCIKMILASIFMSIIVYALKEHNLLMVVIAGALSYAIAIMLFGVVKYAEAKRILSSILKR